MELKENKKEAYKILSNVNIYTGEEVYLNSSITFNQKIIKIIKNNNKDSISTNYILLPGFIDHHTHGGYNNDFMAANDEILSNILSNTIKEGITSIFPTTISDKIINIKKAIKVIKNHQDLVNESKILGVHLEGPFLNPIFKGAQNNDYLLKPNLDIFKDLNEEKIIKIASFAIELDDNYSLHSFLKKEKIIISAAHSNATEEEVSRSLEEGLQLVTHTFNAMSKFSHRDIGLVGSALLYDSLYTELIADLVHVDEKAIKLLYKVKSADKIILITDSMEAKGMDDGTYSLGNLKVDVINHVARLKDSSLAGSCLKYIDGLKNFYKTTNCSINELVKVSSLNIHKLHQLENRGKLSPGMYADFVILDENLNIIQVYRDGNLVVNNEVIK
ncbi:MAG: N-acetylglucosamine-6-phosphate deacetylase [Acholeplasmatales bacterium]|jgi:N-acetylglucosamine-6-phosphate deacetylase|nr:N-acetylglucosamine-6-phosphate deacetylase [Acholeplasmatales bacterium]